MLLPLVASADYTVEIDGIYYILKPATEEAEVTRHPNRYKGEVVIPETVTFKGTEHSVTSIGYAAFQSCSGLTSVTIPNSVTSIGQSAFQFCSGLTSITIPNSVTSIGYAAFQNCSGLTSFTIPNSVTSIGEYAFKNCSGLISVTIPNSVTSIGSYAFSGCSCLASVTIPNSVTSISNFAFSGCSGLTSVTIPNSVTSIGGNAFYKCSSLTSVTIPNSVTSIGNSTFYGCSSLTSVTIPNSVTSIDSYVFAGCSGLASVTIPNSVTSIGESAFSNCSSLTSVTIGSDVRAIGHDAFANCQGLADVYCYAENVPTTEADAFAGSYIDYSTLHVPETSVSAYKAAAPWMSFKNIVALDGSTPETQKCATPTISYVDGEIVFGCETEGVEYVSEIKASDANKYYDQKIVLTNKYIVSVYATKAGYEDSEVATAEISIEGGSGLKGDVNGDGEVGIGDIISITNIMSIRP